MWDLQVLALTLIPLLSGGVPQDGRTALPSELLGVSRQVTREFMIGTWRHKDEFFRWGVTDRQKATLRPAGRGGVMTLKEDGTAEMVNLFTPSAGRWEVAARGIVIHDPSRPEAGSRLIPVRIRDENRIWLLLPFTGGATGIGMERVMEQASHGETAPPARRADIIRSAWGIVGRIPTRLVIRKLHRNKERALGLSVLVVLTTHSALPVDKKGKNRHECSGLGGDCNNSPSSYPTGVRG